MRRFDHRIELAVVFDAHPVEHVDQVFGRDIAGRFWRKRTTADAADARVERLDADLQRGECVGDAGVARVVKMRAQRHRPATALRNRAEQIRAPDPAHRRRSYRRARFRRRPRRRAASRYRARAPRRHRLRTDTRTQPQSSRSHADLARGVAQDLAADGDALVDALTLVARAERVARRHDHADFLQALRRACAVIAAAIQDQARVT